MQESRLVKSGKVAFTCLEVIALILVIPTAIVLLIDLSDRKDQRIATAWGLVTTTAPGNSGKREALEYLNSENQCSFCIDIPFIDIFKEKISMRGVNLSADLHGGPVFLVDMSLEGAEMKNSDFRGSYLDGSNFSGAYLEGANFSGAELTDTNFVCAYLSGADISNVDFSGADLRGAVMDGVDLSGSYIGRVDLRGASLANIIMDGDLPEDVILDGDVNMIEFELISEYTSASKECLRRYLVKN